MKREEVFELINKEREYQVKWPAEFDNKNTPNDWVSYIAIYLGRAVTMPWSKDVFRTAILKVGALAVAILEREEYAPRHYDQSGK